jgi:hypothetical protein
MGELRGEAKVRTGSNSGPHPPPAIGQGPHRTTWKRAFTDGALMAPCVAYAAPGHALHTCTEHSPDMHCAHAPTCSCALAAMHRRHAPVQAGSPHAQRSDLQATQCSLAPRNTCKAGLDNPHASCTCHCFSYPAHMRQPVRPNLTA